MFRTDDQLLIAFSTLASGEKNKFLALHENNNLAYKSRLMRIYKSNAFGDEHYSWIFLDFARVNHSCAPNAEIAELQNEENVKIVAVKPIAKGEEVFISYNGALEDGPRDLRQRAMKDAYGFDCDCATCHLQGRDAWLSDARRQLIHVLSLKQQGFEYSPLTLMDNVGGT